MFFGGEGQFPADFYLDWNGEWYEKGTASGQMDSSVPGNRCWLPGTEAQWLSEQGVRPLLLDFRLWLMQDKMVQHPF